MNSVNVNKGLVTKKFNQFFYVDILENEKNLENMGYKLDIVKSEKHWIRFKVYYEFS